MKFNTAVGLDEAKGSGSFDFKYWFWAKKGSSLGLGYARQPIELDIQRKSAEALDALENIRSVLLAIKDEDEDKLEVIEKKIKANTKRISGIVDLFGAPIIINWLNNEPTIAISVPRQRDGDVTDLNGRSIDVVGLFRDKDTQEFVTEVMDWDKVKINDKDGDTLNTLLAKFLSSVFAPGKTDKQRRTFARGEGLEGAMATLKFTEKGIQIVPFKESDYKLFPTRGSKKMVSQLRKIIEDNFAKVLKMAREAF